jgi:hypothetical protein
VKVRQVRFSIRLNPFFAGQEETPKPRPNPRILPITKFFTKVSGGSNHSGKSQENSKDGQSEKSPCVLEVEQRGSQEAKSELQPKVTDQ